MKKTNFLEKYKTRNSTFILISLLMALQTRSPFMFDFYIDSFITKLGNQPPKNLNDMTLLLIILAPALFIFPILEKRFTIKTLLIFSSFASFVLYFSRMHITSEQFLYIDYLLIIAINFCIICPISMKFIFLMMDRKQFGLLSGLFEFTRIIFGYIFTKICIEIFSGSIIFYSAAFLIISILSIIFIPNRFEPIKNTNPNPISLQKPQYIVLTITACLISALTVGMVYCLSEFNSNIRIFFYAGHDLTTTLERFSNYIIPAIASVFGGIFWDTTTSKHRLLLAFIAFIIGMNFVQLCLPVNSYLLPIVLIIYILMSIVVYSLRTVSPLMLFMNIPTSQNISIVICFQLTSISISALLTPTFLKYLNNNFDTHTAYKLTYQLMMIFSIVCYICIILSYRILTNSSKDHQEIKKEDAEQNKNLPASNKYYSSFKKEKPTHTTR